MNKNTCSDCIFYDIKKDDLSRGYCRFNPPSIAFLPNGSQVSTWPVTMGDYRACHKFAAEDFPIGQLAVTQVTQ